MPSRGGLAALALAAVGFCCAPSHAFYADQAAQDTRVGLRLGPIAWSATAPAPSRNLLVATDAGVVAAVSQRTGEAVWRAALPDGA